MKHIVLIKKIIRCILILMLIVFVVLNIVWFINYKSYDVYLDDHFTRLSYSHNSIVDRSGPTIYGIKKPGYLSFTGNLYIVSEDNSISILIWPSFMCENAREIGLILENGGSTYMVYVDNNMEYHEEKNSLVPASPEEELTVQKVLKERNEEIVKLYHQAKARFANANLEM